MTSRSLTVGAVEVTAVCDVVANFPDPLPQAFPGVEAAAGLAASLEVAASSRSYGAEAARMATALAAVRRRLGEAAYEGAWAAGTARALEEAADEAVGLLSVPGRKEGGP